MSRMFSRIGGLLEVIQHSILALRQISLADTVESIHRYPTDCEYDDDLLWLSVVSLALGSI